MKAQVRRTACRATSRRMRGARRQGSTTSLRGRRREASRLGAGREKVELRSLAM